MEEKREVLVSKFTKLMTDATQKGVEYQTVRDVFLNYEQMKDDGVNGTKDTVARKLKRKGLRGSKGNIQHYFLRARLSRWVEILCSKAGLLLVFFVCTALSSVMLFFFPSFVFDLLDYMFELRDSRCLWETGGMMTEIARPLMKCQMCKDLIEVPVEFNISAADFRQKYAYTAVPVLIKNATTDWSAMHTFSYQYLKELYIGTDGALEAVEDDCQFFPYKTEFETLEDAFNISDDRANFKEGEKSWYIGWSNCHNGVKDKLREQYSRPYFLPNDSESSSLDWIFMGGSGLGAFVHLDYVSRPSWQAQISGTKTWTLIPAPECESICHSMNVTVHKGDIFVIDTNQWYHSTYIHPGEISITIGSEYD